MQSSARRCLTFADLRLSHQRQPDSSFMTQDDVGVLNSHLLPLSFPELIRAPRTHTHTRRITHEASWLPILTQSPGFDPESHEAKGTPLARTQRSLRSSLAKPSPMPRGAPACPVLPAHQQPCGFEHHTFERQARQSKSFLLTV